MPSSFPKKSHLLSSAHGQKILKCLNELPMEYSIVLEKSHENLSMFKFDKSTLKMAIKRKFSLS